MAGIRLLRAGERLRYALGMAAILGQTVAGIVAVVLAALMFAHTSLNLWPIYAWRLSPVRPAGRG